MHTNKKILVVEDDKIISQNIQDAIRSEQMTAEAVYDGLNASITLRKYQYDAIVLDINLPEKSGFEICKEFRSYNTTTPIIILTAFDELDDRLKGFDHGADDYLTKPFYMQELITRIKNMLRRNYSQETNTTVSEINWGTIHIDTERKIVHKQEQEVTLTPREYQLLKKLCEKKGDIVSKQELVQEIWGSSFDANTNTIEVYISFLRNKIDKAFNTATIKTKIGYGYYIEES